MQWYDGFENQPANQTAARRSAPRRFFAMGCMLPLFGLTLIMGMCAVAGLIFAPTAAVIGLNPSTTRTPLPALTPTSLPTLTPTVGPVGVASVAGQPGEAGPVSSTGFSPSGASPSSGQAAAQSNTPAGANPATGAYTPAGANPAAGANAPAGSAMAAATPTATAPPPTPPPAVGQPGNEVVIILPPTATPSPTSTPRPTVTPTAAAGKTTPIPVDAVPDEDSDQGEDDGATDEENTAWSFTGLRTDTSRYQNGMLVYGNVVNNSATPQEIELVSATFYDARGNVIGADNHIQAYWPGYTVPPDGASMPFQLLVNGLSGAADFQLNLGASASSSLPREDFEFSQVKQTHQNGNYCLDGHLRNPGGPLQDYLIITAVLYDQGDNVINFQDEQVYNPSKVVGDQTYHFKICVTPPVDDVTRYEMQAWGY